MKKVLCIIVSFVMVICQCAFAADVAIKDAGKDIVTVSGSIGEEGLVSVMIINPGFGADDVLPQSRQAVQFYGTANEDADGFEIDVRMTDPHGYEGGEYTVVYSNGSVTKTESFVFYFYGKKLDTIKSINEDGVEGQVEDAYRVYSLDSAKLYDAVSTQSLERILLSMGEFEENVDVMYAALLDALHIAAYSDGADILVEDGRLSYVDVVGIDEEDTYEDYLSKLSDSGVKAVHDAVLGGEYETDEDIKDAFSDAVILNYITNAKSMGFGHVSEVFKKYDELLSENGIDTELIDDVDNKNYVYKKLASSTDKNFADLKKTYEKALKNADSQGESTGGGGGGGGGGSFSESTVTIPSDGPSTPVISGQENGSGYIDNASHPFEDMADVSWASESVGALYKRGIISGKSTKAFDPSGFVTREEFAKMAVLAFVGRPDGTQNPFSDVSGWSVPYVASAFAEGIIQGISETTFNPTGNITREQAATIIARAMENAGFKFEKEPETFDDDESISEWAKESIGVLAGEEIINGREDDLFCPGENMTRAEAAKLIYTAMIVNGGI